jgi:hypothetical protein
MRTRAKTTASGRFVLRLTPELHAELQADAKQAGLSLNEYCSRKLGAPLGALQLGPAAALVQRAVEIHGAQLIGVVAFGSWARGEAGPQSDVDVLVVLEELRPLSRALYQPWDAVVSSWGARDVQVHIVHLPQPGAAGSVWAEGAIDGIVLFERGLAVSRRLADIRRDIAEGRLVRRTLHGQPYWAKVA